MVALVSGRGSFWLGHGTLNPREDWDIKHQPTGRGPILISHRCGQPPVEVAEIAAELEAPNVYDPNGAPPF